MFLCRGKVGYSQFRKYISQRKIQSNSHIQSQLITIQFSPKDPETTSEESIFPERPAGRSD